MHQRFLGLLLFAVEAQQALPGFEFERGRDFDTLFGFRDIGDARLGATGQRFQLGSQRARILPSAR